MNFLTFLSYVLGWIYFTAWSVSFYPQVWENYNLKNVNGLSIDYVALNITGYICLATYSTAGYYNQSWDIGTIHIEDLAFAYHGLALTLIIIGQMCYYPIGDNKLSRIIIGILIVLWVYTPLYILLTLVFHVFTPPLPLNAYKIMGYNKLLISLVKYLPQVWWNFKRKTTEGWNVWVSLLDITGGLLSLLQTLIDLVNPDMDPQINIVKFLLGLLTIVFDGILIFQYHRYNRGPHKVEQSEDVNLIQDKFLVSRSEQ